MEESRAKIYLMIINWTDTILTTYYSEDTKSKVLYEGLKAFVQKSVQENAISSAEAIIALDIIEKYKVN